MPPSSAITVCLVEEARHGPFVLHAPSSAAGIEAAVETAAAAGFAAVEIFPPSAAEVPRSLGRLVAARGLRVAAVGTGAGWVRQPSDRRRFAQGIVSAVWIVSTWSGDATAL